MSWSRRLEIAAYVSLFLSMLSHLGEAPSYNAALSIFTVFAHHTQRGRHIFVGMVSTTFSLVLDVMNLSSLNLHDRWNIVPLICIPLLAILKIFILVSSYWIFLSIGGTWSLWETSVPVEEGDEMMDGHSTLPPGRSPARTPSMVLRSGSFGQDSSGSRTQSMSEVPGERASMMPRGAGGRGGGGGGGAGGYVGPSVATAAGVTLSNLLDGTGDGPQKV